MSFNDSEKQHGLIVVAHPDDEVLWCGGWLLNHCDWQLYIVTLCRGSDLDRAPKFKGVLAHLGAKGQMGDLDDGPDQTPLSIGKMATEIKKLIPKQPFDLVLTHGPAGEYTRHRRHEECSAAVVRLWKSGILKTKQLWMFAFEDEGRAYLPRVRRDADHTEKLSQRIWGEKYKIMTELYGFLPDSWEAKTTPKEEGFWCFKSPAQAALRIQPFLENLK